MTVSLVFDADIKNGGSYQMSINNLLAFKKDFEKKNINFHVFTHQNYEVLNHLNIKYEIVKITLLDYIFILLKNIYIINYLIYKFSLFSCFEKKLLKKNIHLVIFLFTSYKAFLLRKIKFTSTVLDVCHRDFSNFKEVKGKVFFFREYLNKKILPLSSLIITESVELKKKIIKFYKINPDKIISIVNMPSKLIKSNANTSLDIIKKKYSIKSNFYFYPAQFWSHKNHILILRAAAKLKKTKNDINFIFCGRDKGNLSFIKKKILDFKIEKNIKILDYVSDNEIFALYSLCKALIMPTYFGPTNIPPVEAWYLNVPVLYSSLHKKHGKNAALYFNPKSVTQLVNSILKLNKIEIRNKLINNGKKRLKALINENIIGHSKFVNNVSKLLQNNNLLI
jgi:glycosyltransferase involved in cell wall biosynthesis